MEISKAILGYRLGMLTEGYSPSTLTSYLSSLGLLARYLHDPDIRAVTLEQLKSWFLYLHTQYIPPAPAEESRLSSCAIHGKWKALRSFYNWAAAEFGIPNIAKEIPAPHYTNKPITAYTEEEIKRLMNACEHTAASKTNGRKSYTQRRPTATRDKALLLLLLDTGARVGEVSRLTVGDLNPETGQLIIRPFARGRKTHGRLVYLGKTSRRAVWRYLTQRGSLPDDAPLFETDGDPMPAETMKNIIEHLGQRAGLHAHAHKFRHTFAVQYLRNGGDVFTLQRLLGHSSLDMVRRYLDLANADDQAAHQHASPADRWKL